MKILKFRKKPVVIEAFQWFTKMGAAGPVRSLGQNTDQDEHFGVVTLEGQLIASDGDWIITGVKGEHYPCKPDIFDATYESVEGEINAE